MRWHVIKFSYTDVDQQFLFFFNLVIFSVYRGISTEISALFRMQKASPVIELIEVHTVNSVTVQRCAKFHFDAHVA